MSLYPVAPIKVSHVYWYDERFYEITFVDGTTDFLPGSTTILQSMPTDVQLIRWRADVGNAIADARLESAGDSGKNVHEACYVYSMGGYVLYRHPKWPEKSEAMLKYQGVVEHCTKHGIPYKVLYDQKEKVQQERFAKWLRVMYPGKPEIVARELTVYSLKHRFAGTLDYVLYLEEGQYDVNGSEKLTIPVSGLYIIDLKTGHINLPKFRMQLASYKVAVEESESYERIQGTIIVHLAADTKRGIEGVRTYLRMADSDEGNTSDDFADFLAVKRLFEIMHPDFRPKLSQFENVSFWDQVEAQVPGGMVLHGVRGIDVGGTINAVAPVGGMVESKPTIAEQPAVAGKTDSPPPTAKKGKDLTDIFPEMSPTPEPKKDTGERERLIAEVEAKINEMYPGAGIGPTRGRNVLVTRMFAVDGKPTITTVAKLTTKTVDEIRAAMPILDSDIAELRRLQAEKTKGQS